MRHSTIEPLDANAEITCEAFLDSSDGLPDGWWNIPLDKASRCTAKAIMLYTMKSGNRLHLCAHHGDFYRPRTDTVAIEKLKQELGIS